MNILLADDNTMLRELLEEFLRGLKHTVLAAEDGLKALEIYNSSTAIDLLITDIIMPGINGIELAKTVRIDEPEMPIIIISGFAQQDTYKQVFSLNAKIYEKPVDLRVLKSHIESLQQEK